MDVLDQIAIIGFIVIMFVTTLYTLKAAQYLLRD